MKAPLLKKSKEVTPERLGDYRLVSRLGEHEWLAKSLNNRTAPPVQIKLLTDFWGEVPTSALLDNFDGLSRILAVLDHPLTWPVSEAARVGNCLYLVSPYRGDATTLEKRLEEGQLPLPHIVNLINEVLEGLDFAHRRKMMHGSLNPANVLVFPVGPLALRNFGLVKFERDNAGLTFDGLTPLDPAYNAPEQFIGCGDYRSDLYAVGVMLYRLLTGELPFKGETPLAVGRQHLNAPLPLPHPALPYGLVGFLAQALARRPEDRFASADRMATAFEKATPTLFAQPASRPVGQPSQIQPPTVADQDHFAYSSTNSTEFMRM